MLTMSGQSLRKCPYCDIDLQFAQKVPFRIKGTPGIWKLFFGELPELKKCVKCGKKIFQYPPNIAHTGAEHQKGKLAGPRGFEPLFSGSGGRRLNPYWATGPMIS
jgi:hypothetical protein